MVNLLSIASSTERALRKNHTEAAPHRYGSFSGLINKASREGCVLFNTVLDKLFYLVNALSSGLVRSWIINLFEVVEDGHGELKQKCVLVGPFLFF